MPVRKMTPVEARRIFGNGIIILGQKRPDPQTRDNSPQHARQEKKDDKKSDTK